MNTEGRPFDVSSPVGASRPASSWGNTRGPNNGKAYRMMARPSSSGNLHQRTTPDFFKDTRIRTCSSIKLIDGVPKAVSFPLADKRARYVSKQASDQKRLMADLNSTVYQYFLPD